AYKSDTKKIVSALVYSANGGSLCVDALTGKVVNYDGSEISEFEEGKYTDLEGSKYAKYAEKLAKYGIFLADEEGRLNESEAITAGDFNSLISNAGLGWFDLSTVTITDIKEDTKLTRQTAAVLLVSSRFGKDVAELPGIYRSKFSDVPEDSKFVGYIVISDAAGFIKGNSSGKFRPNKAFTRGEALKLVYDVLAKA
ncbi:MAG: S-layer homology domain-containing protein, partial [Ruminiclostridium sp.]|nr:S-layer homology domain-containing protein [Ruminiclostridium sp.]